ncbi:hypothetical protein PRABACTJOHN_00144 [Parabacteroides johnsonii DSM 18315]|uniref:Uncharacterized protein n=1 Tax=Parabacteroides johnsonii DSM 18315 TaxID=537006 RepID=B7B552_9BACT|nr:hypothetical protein PRABACTJOHN_00144 [Parabacteroides johnsonii DSM 18315]
MAFTFGACFCMPSSFAGERPLELLFQYTLVLLILNPVACSPVAG